MMNIAVTTTDVINGYTIKEYYGLVSARIVVGVSLVSEFIAGFSDVFGGRSKELEGELGELYDSALKQLKENLKKTRGNAVIGVRMDMDQISAKNTMMFMINVYGTSVRVEKNNYQGQEHEIVEQRNYVDSKRVESRLQSDKFTFWDLNKLLREASDDTTFSISLLLSAMKRCRSNDFHESDYNVSQVMISEYINSFKAKEVFKEVSVFLINNWSELKTDMREYLLNIIRAANDYNPEDMVHCMSQLPMAIWPMSVLPPIINMKHKYTVEEAQQLALIVGLIGKEPPIAASEVKGMFGSKQLKCICGGVIVDDRCQVCNKDKFGFTEADYNILKDAREVIVLTYEWLNRQTN